MTASRYGHFIRHAAVASRRRSLRALGGAGLTAVAVAAPALAGAGKARKKKARKRCQQDGAQCRAVVPELCTGAQDPAACEANLFVCCEHLARCRVEAAVLCIRDND